MWSETEEKSHSNKCEPIDHGRGTHFITADLFSLPAPHPKCWCLWNLDESGRQLKKWILNNGAETERKPREMEWFFTGQASTKRTVSSDHSDSTCIVLVQMYQTFAQKKAMPGTQSQSLRNPTTVEEDDNMTGRRKAEGQNHDRAWALTKAPTATMDQTTARADWKVLTK